MIQNNLLGEGWRIKKDAYNWCVQKLTHTHKGREIWQSTDFYPKLEDAVMKIQQYKFVKQGGEISLAVFVQKMRQFQQQSKDFALEFENEKLIS